MSVAWAFQLVLLLLSLLWPFHSCCKPIDKENPWEYWHDRHRQVMEVMTLRVNSNLFFSIINQFNL